MLPSAKLDRLNANASAEKWRQGDYFLQPLRKAKQVFADDAERLRFCRDEFSKSCTDGHSAKLFRARGIVALAFPPGERREELSFQHHAEVVAVEPDRREALLALAERDRLSPVQLRRLVAGAQPRAASFGKGLFIPLKFTNTGLRWLAAEVRKAPLHEWPVARRLALRQEFRPLLVALGQI